MTLQAKPWLLVTFEDALEHTEVLKKIADTFDIIIVKKEDLKATARLVEEMRETRMRTRPYSKRCGCCGESEKFEDAPVAQLDGATVS